MADLKRTLENSVIAWLASATHGQSIPIAASNDADSDAITLPAIVVRATPGNESIPATGIVECDVAVAYHWQADDTADTSASAVWDKIMAALRWDALAARLSDATSLTVWGVQWDGSESHDIDERKHVQTFTFRAHAQAS
jgi:hypothetical protein